MSKTIFTIITFSLLIQTAFAGRVQVSQWIPWSFLQKEMLLAPLSYSRKETDLRFSIGELNPTADLITFDVDGRFDAVNIDHVGIDAQSSYLAADIQVSGLGINQTVIRNVGGNQIEVKIEAACTPVTISVHRFEAVVSSEFIQTRSSWDIALNSVDLNFPAGQWTIGAFSCRGASGIDQTITNLVAKLFQDPAVLETFLRDQLNPVISAQWKKSWATLISSTKGQLQNVQLQAPGDLGLRLSAEIPLNSAKKIPMLTVSDSRLSKIFPQLLISTNGYQALLEDKLLSAAPQGYNLQKIPAFYNLMRNRLEQFIVWTDLRKFPVDAYFGLTTDPSKSTLTLEGDKAHIKALGHVEVYKGSKKVNYLDWNIGLTATLTTTLKDSILTFKTSVPTSTINWNFNRDYLNNYAYNTRVSSNILENAIRSSFTAQTASQTLPILKWQNRSYKLQKLNQSGDVITMNWVR